MHLLLTDTQSLDATEEAVDLGQSPADLVFLSFTDTDLAALSAAHDRLCQALGPAAPSLRIASLQKLKHPASVDLYVERVAANAKAIVVRLLGGLDYWRYGAEELGRIARDNKIALAILPGDGREDPRSRALSTLGEPELALLDRYSAEGGIDNLVSLLNAMAFYGGLTASAPMPPGRAMSLAKVGFYEPGLGPCCPHDNDPIETKDGRVLICFYRSLILADDKLPIDALIHDLRQRGLAVRALFVNSLKDPESALWVERLCGSYRPDVILNATAFSAKAEGHDATPLDAACVPVMQVILSGSAQAAWHGSSRGLSAADLAMNVVLPELDGRLIGGVISFKSAGDNRSRQEWPVQRHMPVESQIASVGGKAEKLIRLAKKPVQMRKIALILSDYPGAGPGAGRLAHAVGLDGPASALQILRALQKAGYHTGDLPRAPDAFIDALQRRDRTLSADDYSAACAALPESLQADLMANWGDPATYPELQVNMHQFGHVLVAVQPDRGASLDRKAGYHDPHLPPTPAYVAFYHGLAHAFGMDAMIHLGTHGTLEWLPGKANALSADCYPQQLSAERPIFYPFIVNNPGEAATAKRRLSAATIGHLTPPLADNLLTGPLADLERLVDDLAAADGLDPRRAALLQAEIVKTAKLNGLEEECGLDPQMTDEAAVAQLDAYLCDLKDLQIRDGLHVFGSPSSFASRAQTAHIMAQKREETSSITAHDIAEQLKTAANCEMDALLSGLNGHFIKPGPAGAPSRGRLDVLPTGRNLYTVDPRAVPTRTAFDLGSKAAQAFIQRYLQENGDYPRSVIFDLWGSATMRTGGDEFAQAIALLGARPCWDAQSNRVSGFEILSLAQLTHPRIDVTLRLSGLFRDVFEPQMRLFNALVRAIAARDEPADWNPLKSQSVNAEGRLFGAAPGAYGSGLGDILASGAWTQREDLGAAYLAHSAYSYQEDGTAIAASEAFGACLARADAHVQIRDNAESDLLERTTYGEFQGGISAAAAALGNDDLQLFVADTAQPSKPVVRSLTQEVQRVVRGRAVNPHWLQGQMRHGYAGAGEMASTLDALFAEAATTALPFSRQFDLYYDATLGDEAVANFLAQHNGAAAAAMRARFLEAIARGLWQPRRNSVLAKLDERFDVAAQ